MLRQLILICLFGISFIEVTGSSLPVPNARVDNYAMYMRDNILCNGEIEDSYYHNKIIQIFSNSTTFCGVHLIESGNNEISLEVLFDEGHSCNKEYVSVNGVKYCGDRQYFLTINRGVVIYVSLDNTEKRTMLKTTLRPVTQEYTTTPIETTTTSPTTTMSTTITIPQDEITTPDSRQYQHIRSCTPVKTIDRNSIIHVRYLNNQNCRWIVQAEPFQRVVISGSFAIEYHVHCDYDRLTLNDGSTTNKRCGNDIQMNNVYHNRSSIQINFITDGSLTKSNFDITITYSRYTPADLTTPRHYLTPAPNAVNACQANIYRNSMINVRYNNNANCRWNVILSEPRTITVVSSFIIESSSSCRYDYFQAGNRRNCGRHTNARFVFTNTNSLVLLFKTDSSVKYQDFSVHVIIS